MHRRTAFPASARSLALAALTVLPATGCKKADAAGTAPIVATARNLVIVQGDGQARQANRKLPIPLVFRATDDNGRGVSALPLTVVVDQGGGAVDSASVKTDANGEARVRWTLGTTTTQTLVATAPGVQPVRANATVIQPAEVVIVQGNNQTARAGAALPIPIVVRVLGPNNLPMDSLPIALQIVGGGGTVTPQTIVTSTVGEASVKWTLGSTGINTAAVRVGALEPTILTATATP